ncbi:MAG: prenyltransferase/squalene oxidase repeat-containing protein [Gemmataceae bacterium]
MRRGLACLALLGVAFAALPAHTQEIDAKERQEVIAKAIAFLKSSQGADGSFSPKIAGPGVTSLVVAGLLKNGVSPKEPVVEKGLKFIESQVQKDGGIYSKGLATYTTSVAVMALSEANRDKKYDAALKNAGDFLKRIQIDDSEKPTHGGFNYGDKKSAPDMSNTAFAIEALIAAGIPKDDPALEKAKKFVSRTQNLPGETNDMPFAKKASKEDAGGFVYNPFAGPDSKHATAAGGLRSVGSMTYSGLKSFLYTGVSKEDPRARWVQNWIRAHYTLDENPGLGKAASSTTTCHRVLQGDGRPGRRSFHRRSRQEVCTRMKQPKH